MNNRVYLVMTFILILCTTQLLMADPFAKRITNTDYQKITFAPYTRIHAEEVYSYTDTEPALLNSLTRSTTTISNTDSTTVIIRSVYEGVVYLENDLTNVVYYEYRDGYTPYYGYFRFVMNSDDKLVEVISRHPNLPDSVHAYFHYRADGQPDSLYYMKGINSSVTYYKLFYDQFNRLDHSLQYLYYPDYNESYLFRRFTQHYSANPAQYPAPLDLENYRFYSMTGAWNGAFEESVPIFDKNYAAQSISYEQWDDWSESWSPITSSFYGAQYNGGHISLINGQPNNYTGYFYYNDSGCYIGRDIIYNNSTIDDYQVYWAYGVPNDDPVETPTVPLISAYPNPFNFELNIKLDSKRPINGDISIYNIKGQLIRSWKGIKSNELTWDGKDKDSKPVKSGVYLIKAKQNNQLSVMKVIKL